MLAGLAAALGLLVVASEHDSAMACDDAYIYFRYAENLQNGHGIRWNMDMEPSEGYVNILQILQLALLGVLGIAPTTGAMWLSLISVAGTVAILAAVARPTRWYFPLSCAPALAFLLDGHVLVHATRGLDTLQFAFFAVAMTAAVGALVSRQGRSTGLAGIAAASSILLFLSRPEGVLLLGTAWCAALILLRLRRQPMGPALAGFLAVLAAGAAYSLWKRSYFGYWLPNPFYLKGALPGFRGVHETLEFLRAYRPMLVIFGVLMCAMPLLLRFFRQGAGHLSAVPASALLVAAMCAPWLVYTAKIWHDVGFDHRFAFPIVPVILLGMTACLSAVLSNVPAFQGRAVLAWVGPTALLASSLADLRSTWTALSSPRPSGDPFTVTFLRLGNVIRETGLADRLTLVCTNAGATPYVAKCRHIDPVGLTDNMLCGRTPAPERDRYRANLRYDLLTSLTFPASEGAVGFDQDPRTRSTYLRQFRLGLPVGLDLSKLADWQRAALEQRKRRVFDEMCELRDANTLVGEMSTGTKRGGRQFVYVRKDSELHAELVQRLGSTVDIPAERIDWDGWPP